MEPDSLVLPGKNRIAQKRLDAEKVLSILWDSVFKSLYRAFVILIMGEIALGIAGSIWEAMTPSKRPGISISLGNWGGWTSGIQGHGFGILWALSFITISGFRLARYLPDARHRSFVRRLRKIERRISKNWFRLMVGNAFGALVSAIVVYCVSQFSWSGFLWKLVIEPIIAWVFHVLSFVVGANASGAIQGWMSWYGENQFQFTFWGIYIGSIADDLGLPNVKTLGRWAWIRLQRKFGNGEQGAPETAAHF